MNERAELANEQTNAQLLHLLAARNVLVSGHSPAQQTVKLKVIPTSRRTLSHSQTPAITKATATASADTFHNEEFHSV